MTKQFSRTSIVDELILSPSYHHLPAYQLKGGFQFSQAMLKPWKIRKFANNCKITQNNELNLKYINGYLLSTTILVNIPEET